MKKETSGGPLVKSRQRTGVTVRNTLPQRSVLKQPTPKKAALAKLIVSTRQVQGWNLQPAKDARLMGAVWEQQLDRRGVDHRLYDKLVDMAVDYRTVQIGRGEQPTPLTVELMLACFEHYKRRALEEHQRMKIVIDALRSTCEMVANGQKSIALGLADFATVGEVPDGIDNLADFSVLATGIVGDLQKKYDSFLQEKYLEITNES